MGLSSIGYPLGDRPHNNSGVFEQIMDVIQSKYNFHKQSDGFLIEAVDRTPVRITATPTSIVVTRDGSHQGTRFSPINIPGIAKCAAEGLMLELRQSDGKPQWDGIHEWARRQTAGAIYGRVRECCGELTATINPLVLQVHSKVFAATHGYGGLEFEEELYNHSYIVNDILRYPAAAVACRYARKLGAERGSESFSFGAHPRPSY
jgi:hypothetical protein